MTKTTLKLPPISVIDDLLPNGSWSSPTASLPTPEQQWKSPPYQFNSSNSVDDDIDQVISQCHSLSDNMNQLKQTDYMPSRPLLDDMIQSANQVLNALLRLRKYQLQPVGYKNHCFYYC